MKYCLFLFGLFFLINPYFWVIDILPDFIGLLIMAKAISRLNDISPSIEAASKGFKKAAALSIAQLGLLIPMIPIVNSDPTFNLVFSFCFNIIRIIFLIPALHELFNGLIYFSERHAVSKAVSVTGLKTMRTAMQIYFILHALLAMFPESVYLLKVNDSGLTSSFEEIYPLAYTRTGVMFLSAALVVLISLVFYIAACVYFLKLRRKADFNRGIESDIGSYVRSEKKRIMSAIKPAITCFIISCFASVCFLIDGKQIIPPYFAPILHIAVITYLRKILNKKVTRAFSIVATVVAFPLQLFNELFASMYHETASFAFSHVKTQFMFPFSLNVIYTFFLVLSSLCVGIALYRMIKEHTGLFWESEYVTHNSKAANEKLALLRWSVVLTIAYFGTAIFNCFAFGKQYDKPMLINYAAILTIIVAICASILYSMVRTSVLEKYSTENKMN